MIAVRSLSFSYGPKGVLDGVDFAMQEPGLYPLAGLNGGGKSTLCRLLAGLIAPCGGSVSVGGREPSKLPVLQRARLVSYVPQEDDIFPAVVVGELLDMAFFPKSRRYWTADFGATGTGVIKRLGLSRLLKVRYGELSGGQKRKVLIAAGFLQDSPLVVLDEPLAFLDPKSKGEVEAFIGSWSDRFIVVSGHDLPFIERHFDRAIFLRQGKVLRAGREDFVEDVYG